MVGETVSHYRILEEVGRGGMGVVYKAQDLTLNRFVALKFLPRHLTDDSEEKQRFIQEAQAVSALNHPNVCTIYELGAEKDQQFIAMEFVEGETLSGRVQEKGCSLQEAIGYAVQIGDALTEAHSKGIIHRDVKAENIMINAKNQIKVMDFGLAKLKGSMKLTRTSSTVGTLAYMAPEQIQGEAVDGRSDIFSFGIVLYEMLTRRTPFRGEHEAAVMYSIMNENPASVLEACPEAPPELDHILKRALEKDPEDRYQRVDDMVSELRRLQKRTSRVSRTFPAGEAAGRQSQQTEPQREQAVQPDKRRRFGKIPLAVGAGVVAIAVLAVILYMVLPGPVREVKSMAVLPFVNAAGDPNAEYLSDGFTESLINTLSKLPGIRMMSRSSVFRFKGADVDPQKAGKDLGVDAVLTGRILERNGQLSISTELINVRDNSHIWGDQFNRGLTDILAVQSEISQKISDQLKITLTRDEQKRLTTPATQNTEAYQLYLKGRFYLNRRTSDGFAKALQYFQGAIDKDPSYSLAYAGLADTYALMAAYFILSPDAGIAKSRAAARKAVELDGTLGEPHVTLATLSENLREWTDAGREYRLALELSPNYATGHQWYGEYLNAMGHMQEGIDEDRKAQGLDPLAPILYCSLGQIYTYVHRLDDARQQFNKALEIDPNFPRAHAGLGWVAEVAGDYDEAIRRFSTSITLADSGIEYLVSLGFVYGRAGQRSRAQEILNYVRQVSQHQYVSPFLIAVLYGGMGENDEAFSWLNRAFDSRDPAMEYIRLDPSFDPLRGDPRFTALTKKMSFPE